VPPGQIQRAHERSATLLPHRILGITLK